MATARMSLLDWWRRQRRSLHDRGRFHLDEVCWKRERIHAHCCRCRLRSLEQFGCIGCPSADARTRPETKITGWASSTFPPAKSRVGPARSTDWF